MNGHRGRKLIALLGDRRLAWLGLLLAAVLALPAARALLEASMWRHMVLQYPLWMLAGALLAGGLSAHARERLARWNASGISGLLLAGTVLAVLMIPRVLDLALVAPAVELAKCSALLTAGAALRLSWRQAGLVAQGFFLGNMLLMGAVVGQLYAQSPLRLCNAYLLGDQERLGQWLTAISTMVALLWLAQVFWWVARRDADTGRMAGPQAPQDAAARTGSSAPSPQSP
ncbi:hypothetical protein [Comamonas sp. NLF-1-9]|uniref:hypothetical protein n=1 Tax=Comamonas sp. NLF-1-9 TaxID=2853163 RepID=UPI002104BAF9|nr:hypothetical protein [Comamonas sp. NLF-1-9]